MISEVNQLLTGITIDHHDFWEKNTLISPGADRVGKVDSAEERGTRQAAGQGNTCFTHWVTSHDPVGRDQLMCGSDGWNPLLFTAK